MFVGGGGGGGNRCHVVFRDVFPEAQYRSIRRTYCFFFCSPSYVIYLSLDVSLSLCLSLSVSVFLSPSLSRPPPFSLFTSVSLSFSQSIYLSHHSFLLISLPHLSLSLSFFHLSLFALSLLKWADKT